MTGLLPGYIDVTSVSVVASQITDNLIVFSTVCSVEQQI